MPAAGIAKPCNLRRPAFDTKIVSEYTLYTTPQYTDTYCTMYISTELSPEQPWNWMKQLAQKEKAVHQLHNQL